MHLIAMKGVNSSGSKKWKTVAAGVHGTMGACLSWVNCTGSQNVPFPDGTPLRQKLGVLLRGKFTHGVRFHLLLLILI